MVQPSESKYFKEQKAKSLNYTVNSKATWRPDLSEVMKIVDTMKRVQSDLEGGILTKLKLTREQELEKIIASKCYTDPSLTFLQGQECENFHRENDFKLNLLGSFF